MSQEQIPSLDPDLQITEQIANLRRELAERFEAIEQDIHDLAEAMLTIDARWKGHRSSIDASLTSLDLRGQAETGYLDRRLRILEGWADRQRSYVDAAVRQLVGRATRPRGESGRPI